MNCPGCGRAVEQGGRGLGRVFCSTPCRLAFNNRMKTEGSPIAALVKAWTLTRHAKPGTEEAEVCRFARNQLTQIAGMHNEADQEAGRPSAIEYVKTLMASGTIYADRRQERRPKADDAEDHQLALI